MSAVGADRSFAATAVGLDTRAQVVAELRAAEKLVLVTHENPDGDALGSLVGMHRILFRRHRLDALVSAAHACAIAGLVLLGLALAGVGVVVFDTVVGRT